MKRAASTAGKHYSRKAYQQALALVFTISDMFVLPPLALNWRVSARRAVVPSHAQAASGCPVFCSMLPNIGMA